MHTEFGGPVTEEPIWDRRMETMSRDELRVVQGQRLHWQVQRCWKASPFYRERLRGAGVTPGDILTVDDVTRLPILYPEELRTDLLSFPPFGRAAVAPGEWWDERTDGDGGTGWAAIWTAADLVHRTNLAARALWSFGCRPGDTVVNTLDRPSPADRAVNSASLNIGARLVNSRDGHAAPVDTPADRCFLIGTRTVLERQNFRASIASTQRRTRGKVAAWLDTAIVDGEAVGSAPDVAIAVGSQELGPTLAAGCDARAGLHWAEDHFLIEVLDDDSPSQAALGTPGRLVITHLTREGTPLLRWGSGLRARLTTDPCTCGRTHARSTDLTAAGGGSAVRRSS